MIFREAQATDIPSLMRVRFAVKENILSNPLLVTEQDCEVYITQRGKGWVCEVDNEVVGFAIADLVDDNVWALFVQPGFDKMGIGKRLHDDMLNWYFKNDKNNIWLSTSPGTRADNFYRKAGWVQTGITKSGEIKFEMKRDMWTKNIL